MKRAWRIIFKSGKTCTMIDPEMIDRDTAFRYAVDRFRDIVEDVV